MTTMTIERDGKLALPPDLRERCGMLSETSVRVIETRNGLLLVPLMDTPMNAELTEELQDWQAFSQSVSMGAVSLRGQSMNPGVIYWVEFPVRGGRAQAGRRPAVVMQSALATAQLPIVLLLPLMTQMDALRFPGTALIEVTPANGLTKTSIALAFQLTVVDKQFIGAYLGTLSKPEMQDVQQALESIIA